MIRIATENVNMSDVVLEQVKELLTKLTPQEKAEVVEWLGTSLKAELPESSPMKRKSVRGLLADLGTAPSAEEIDEARREMWSNFPRDDI
jgi:hypothetical protein